MITNSEYHQRLSRLQHNIQKSNLDVLVIGSDPNVTYLTGTYCSSGDRQVLLIIPSHGEPALIVPLMEAEKMRSAITVHKQLVYWEKDAKPGKGWGDRLQEALGNAQKIGVDPHACFELMMELSDREVLVSDLVEDLRVIKSPAEIELTRRAAKYWTTAMNNMLSIAKKGLPVGELMRVGGSIINDVFRSEPKASRSDTYTNFFFQCAPESSAPHHTNRSDDLLPDGPTILNAIGPVCGYNAENERTILIGDYSDQQADLFDLQHQAHQLALSLIKPGVPCADVDNAVQDFFRQQGLEACLRHRVGHGFGVVYHERPYTSEGSDEVYQPGMLISVEPGVYLEGVGGFRHSDTVLITDTGIDNFTANTPIDRQSLTF